MDPGKQVKIFDFVRAKWDEFQVGIGKSLGEINSAGSIDEYYDSLTKMILKVALKTIPCRGAPKERVVVPWWNSDCDKAVKKRKQAFKTLRRNHTQENVIFLKQCRAVARKTVKDSKKRSWRSFCGTLGPDTPVREVWSRIHKNVRKSCQINNASPE